MNPPITPGEILLEEHLIPMGISQNAMARSIGVAPRSINEIIHARRSITPAMSIRFGAFFGQSPENINRLTAIKYLLDLGIWNSCPSRHRAL